MESVRLPVLISKSSQSGKALYADPKSGDAKEKDIAFKGFEDLKQDRYNKILHHEQLHKSYGGAQAGGITILYDGNGVANSGFVPISLPAALNKQNPAETLNMARIAFASATAPSDMSDADCAVASSAKSMENLAASEFNKQKTINKNHSGQNLNFIA